MHRALKKKKTETGLNVKDLGNCALRSVLHRPLLVEAIGQKLVETGHLSEEEFDVIRAEALRQICSATTDVASIVHQTKHHTMATGSWEIEELARDEADTYQVLSAWVKDHRLRPFTPHRHEGVEFLILLKGSVLISVDIESYIVKAPGAVTIPMGAVHSATPLEQGTLMLAVISPPEHGYTIGEAE